MTIDEATQTNGVPEPNDGKLEATDAKQSPPWTVESGMS
jgi:hypothetical protein